MEGIVNPFWMPLFFGPLCAWAAGKAREAWKEREDFLEKLFRKTDGKRRPDEIVVDNEQRIW